MKLTKYMKQFSIDDKKSLIINSITGAVDIIDNNILKELYSGKLDDPEKNQVIIKLKERGYIVADEKEDYERLKLIVSKQRHMSLATFIICITYKCNLSCSYCFEPSEVKTKNYVLNETDIDKIFVAIKQIMEERGFRYASILLYGGEPFLPSSKSLVAYIMDKAKNNNYVVQAISNGTKIVQYKDILNNYKDIIRNIQITLDGSQKYHDITRKYPSGQGSFSEIVHGIDVCVNIGIPINLRINVGKKNIDGLDELLNYIEDKGWAKSKNFTCQLAPVTDHYCTGAMQDWIPEHIVLEKILSLFDRHKDISMKMGTDMEKRVAILKSVLSKQKNRLFTCLPCSAALRNYFIFGAEGLIYACPETVGIEEQSIGKFKPDFQIEKSKENVWKRDISNIDKCSNCEIAGICGSGCTWSAIATNGKMFENPQCNFAKETVETYFQINKQKFNNL